MRLVTLAFVFTGLQACLDLPTPAQRTILTVGDNSFPGFPDGPRADGGVDSSRMLDAALSPADVGNPPECGNGIVEGDEECDEASDTCSADCLFYACGNGRVDPGEICDDGNQSNIDSCIDSCQVAFPDEWSLYGDWNFTDSSFAFEYCFANFPPNITPGEDSGDTMGRRSYFLWGGENNLWVPISIGDEIPFRLTLTVHIPEGYERSLKAGLVTNFESCAADWQGAFIRQDDLRHVEGEQNVQVSATTTADGVTQTFTGAPKTGRWLALTFEHLPSTGHFRIKYEDELVLQSVLSETIRGFRIEFTQNTSERVETPISVGTFVIELAQSAQP